MLIEDTFSVKSPVEDWKKGRRSRLINEQMKGF
jgi:hypothetical protein